MIGLVKCARGDGFVELREVEEEPPAANQVKIEVRACGICGSDLHILHDEINIPMRPPVDSLNRYCQRMRWFRRPGWAL